VRRSFRLTALFAALSLSLMTISHDFRQILSLNPQPAWADVWHLWRILMPRRSITGRLLWGRVWRRHDGGHWIYKKLVECADDDF
jgi:hypothetical protein